MGALTVLRASVAGAVQHWLERYPDELNWPEGGELKVNWAPRPNGGTPKVKFSVTRYYADEPLDPAHG
jgi:hypothetical protein